MEIFIYGYKYTKFLRTYVPTYVDTIRSVHAIPHDLYMLYMSYILYIPYDLYIPYLLHRLYRTVAYCTVLYRTIP